MIGMPQRMNNGQSQLLKLPSTNLSCSGKFEMNCAQHFCTCHCRESTQVFFSVNFFLITISFVTENQ